MTLLLTACRDTVNPADGASGLRISFSQDTLRFTRSFHEVNLFVQVQSANAERVTEFGSVWQSSDTAIVSPPPVAGPTGATQVGIASKSVDGSAVLTLAVTTADGRTTTDSVVVLVNRVPQSVRLAFTGERTLAAGAFRSWHGSEIDSSGYELRTVPISVVSSDSAVVQVTSSGVHALSAGRVLLVVSWSGGELLRDSVEVVAGYDLGEVHSRSLSTLCPSVSRLVAVGGTSAMRLQPCLGPSHVYSWAFLSEVARPWSAADGLVTLPSAGSVLHLSGDPFKLVQLTSAGVARWSISSNSGTGAAVAAAVSGAERVYAVTNAGLLVAADSSGVRWDLPLPGVFAVAAYQASERTTLFAVSEDSLWQIGEDGSRLWQLEVPGLSSSLAIGSDGELYVWRRAANTILGVSFQGIVLFETAAPFDPPPAYDLPWLALTPSGLVVVAGSSDLIALSPDGSLRWAAPFDRLSRPVVGDDGRVYALVGAEGNVIAVESEDGTMVGRTLNALGRSPVGSDELLLEEGRLIGTDGVAMNWIDVPFKPAVGWSQAHGTSGMTNSTRKSQ